MKAAAQYPALKDWYTQDLQDEPGRRWHRGG